MTGTAKTEEEEFQNIYNLDVVVIPTNLPMIRIDENDQIYTKNRAKSTRLSRISKIVRNVVSLCLSARFPSKSRNFCQNSAQRTHFPQRIERENHKMEADIVAQAGRIGAVTIATNMAGRGTDIMLGGNPEYLAKQRLEKKDTAPKISKPQRRL